MIIVIEHTGTMGCKETPVYQYQMKFRRFEAFANENKGNRVVDVAFGRIKHAYESWNARQSSGIILLFIIDNLLSTLQIIDIACIFTQMIVTKDTRINWMILSTIDHTKYPIPLYILGN